MAVSHDALPNPAVAESSGTPDDGPTPSDRHYAAYLRWREGSHFEALASAMLRPVVVQTGHAATAAKTTRIRAGPSRCTRSRTSRSRDPGDSKLDEKQTDASSGTRTGPHRDPLAATVRGRHGAPTENILEREPVWARDFNNLDYEWRRLFSELFGTFLLVLAGAGASVVDTKSHGQVGRAAAVTAPGLTVLVVILFMGAVSGAHLNPVVSVAFALRGDFGWRRVPGYLIAQLAGALLAGLVLRATFGAVAHTGATLPGSSFSAAQAFVIEAILSLGLVSTILGTSSTAQNLGPLSAFGVGAYIALARMHRGVW
jgi:hypothetical protein